MKIDDEAARAWELARFEVTALDKPEVANAYGGELVNALRSTFMRGFREGRASVPPEEALKMRWKVLMEVALNYGVADPRVFEKWLGKEIESLTPQPQQESP